MMCIIYVLGMRNEGWFDPWTLLLALKVKAASLGVIFVKGELVDFTTKDDKGIRDGQVIKKDVLDYAHVSDLVLRPIQRAQIIYHCNGYYSLW